MGEDVDSFVTDRVKDAVGHSLGGHAGEIAGLIPELGRDGTCTFHFWPLGELCRREPDVLLELDAGGRLYHIVVEAQVVNLFDLQAKEHVVDKVVRPLAEDGAEAELGPALSIEWYVPPGLDGLA